jgi:hypothetical protein
MEGRLPSAARDQTARRALPMKTNVTDSPHRSGFGPTRTDQKQGSR